MKKIYLIVFGLLVYSSSRAQETVTWATQVIDVSSEYSPYEYSAIQILHRPNVLPNGSDEPNSWRPKSQNKEESILVSFHTPIKAKQITIAESENPGAVKAVYGYDSDYNEFLLFELTPRELPIPSRFLNLFFEETPYAVQAVRVVLDCSVSDGYNAIDAIGISGSNIPLNVLLNLAPGVNSEVDAEKLGTNVNSDYIEYSPIISPDGKKLYFSRQFHPDNVGGVNDAEDIWFSELDIETGKWLPAKNIGPPLNTKGPNFISSISTVAGEEVLILGNRYGKKGRMDTGVSMSTQKENSFSDPVSIKIKNEYNYSPNADFFLAPDGKAMIMSIERDDTYGARDLYVSFKRKGGSWSEPMNLGDDINSVGEDESPFMAEDGRTLYFSSDGYAGYGGADIYVSFKLDDTWKRWSVPENLGPGINKEGNDEYLSIPIFGKNLYFTRGEKDEDADIFSFKMKNLFSDQVSSPPVSSADHLAPKDIIATISGTVIDAKTEKPIEGTTVLIERLPDGLDIGHATTNESGGFNFTVQGGWEYGLVGEAEGYISETERLDFVELKKSDTIKKLIRIFPIQKGETLELKTLLFDFDKTDLKPASYPELNRVLYYLKRGTIEKIVIGGHTDSVGDKNYNLNLSSKRAKAVMDYFIEKGISRDRLSHKAYGEAQPKVTNNTHENRKKNRRVEFMIQ